MNRIFRTIACMLLTAMVCTANEKNGTPQIVVPNKRQIEWAEMEIGVLIHFDMPTYVPGYNWRQFGTHPAPSTFNPTELDTDQWLKAAKDLGAKYAVLVAKHCSGFSLWPTEAHDYSVKHSPWKNGKGDIVRDFVNSCKKYGIKPGIYASTSANGYCWVDNPGKVQKGSPYTQEQYNRIVEKQLTELWSNYGELFEVWFDGGVLPVSQGGADILALLNKYQPDAIAFQGPMEAKNLIRWVGNEEGTAPDPSWATTDATTQESGTIKVEGLHGNPYGKLWCPGEADFTLRHNSSFQGGWFWTKNQDNRIFTLDELMKKYCNSVGRNTNMLLGIVIDDRGLVPDADVQRLKEFGQRIRKEFSTPLASANGSGRQVELVVNSPQPIRYIRIREDISKGERVLKYRVEALQDGNWTTVHEGRSIGNNRIIPAPLPGIETIRLIITEQKDTVYIKELAVF